MIHFRMADHVYACEFEGGHIVLDLEANRYRYVGGLMHEALKIAVAGEQMEGTPPALINRMIDLGILTSVTGPSASAQKATRGQLRCSDRDGELKSFSGPRHLSPRSIVPLVRMLATVGEVRKRPLFAIIKELLAAKIRMIEEGHGRSEHDLAVMVDVVAAQRIAEMVLGANRWCLPFSICTMRTAIASRFPARLVIGVVDRPFQAHCWVEIGEFVLTDAPARVAPFKPILII